MQSMKSNLVYTFRAQSILSDFTTMSYDLRYFYLYLLYLSNNLYFKMINNYINITIKKNQYNQYCVIYYIYLCSTLKK